MYLYLYMCMCVYIYIYIHIHRTGRPGLHEPDQPGLPQGRGLAGLGLSAK